MKTQVAECAKAIRAELKALYPQIKFSVTSETFSMGNAVRIEYTDGVKVSEIEEVVNKYQYGHFDSMTDSYNHSNRREDLPQAKFIQISRQKSPEAIAMISEKIKQIFEDFSYEGWVKSAGEYGFTLVHREFYKISF